MTNRMPIFQKNKKICVICEGNEEFEYLTKLKALQVWGNCYDVICVNAEGNGNIFARYQDKFQNGSYDMVFVFCDTDRKPYEQYEEIKRKINDFHGNDEAADKIVIFGNPCTMQIIILHWEDILLKSHLKNKNAPIIERNTGIKNYKARKDQIQVLIQNINVKNYEIMKERVSKLSMNDLEIGSSNFSVFINYLSDSSSQWIDELNHLLL